jgi:hypothetical protein
MQKECHAATKPLSLDKNIEKKKNIFQGNPVEVRSFDSIFFPEQVDPAAGMSERSSARESGRPARPPPATRAPQNSRHGQAAAFPLKGLTLGKGEHGYGSALIYCGAGSTIFLIADPYPDPDPEFLIYFLDP